jgi:hypothetical protein
MNTPVQTKRSRRMLLLMLCLFMAPLAAAFWLYYGTGWRPASSTNHGELIQPARALPEVALRHTDGAAAGSALLHGKWSLVVVGDGTCGEVCQFTLNYARQTVLGMGRQQIRVQGVWLVTANCCEQANVQREQHELLLLNASDASAASLLRLFPEADRERMIFIVDPLGNLMMRYDTRLEPRGLRLDLKQLLDLSQIG